jgi:hypothetical protein
MLEASAVNAVRRDADAVIDFELFATRPFHLRSVLIGKRFGEERREAIRDMFLRYGLVDVCANHQDFPTAKWSALFAHFYGVPLQEPA